MSVSVVLAALKDPWILYHETIWGSDEGLVGSNLARSMSNSFVSFEKWIPSLTRTQASSWGVTVFWLIVLSFVIVIFIKKPVKKAKERSPLRLALQLCLVFCLAIAVLVYAFFDIHLENKVTFENQNYELYFQNDDHFGKELGGFWTKALRRTDVILRSKTSLSAIQLSLSSPREGTTFVQVGAAKEIIERKKRTGFVSTPVFLSPEGFPKEESHLYYLSIKDVPGFFPYRLDKSVQDNRHLGVFVRISVK